MTANEVMDLLFALSVQILELVQGGKLNNIQAIWSQNIRFSFQQVLRLQTSNFTENKLIKN
jgi:hypothetical protein